MSGVVHNMFCLALEGVKPPPCDNLCRYRTLCKHHYIACETFLGYSTQTARSGRPSTVPDRATYLRIFRDESLPPLDQDLTEWLEIEARRVRRKRRHDW